MAQQKLDLHAPGAGRDAPPTWPRAEAAAASHAAAPAHFVAPNGGAGDSALPEVRASEPGLDPRWPPVAREGDAAPAAAAQSDAQGGVPLTPEEVAKHNKADDCWVRASRAACPCTLGG